MGAIKDIEFSMQVAEFFRSKPADGDSPMYKVFVQLNNYTAFFPEG